MGLFLGCFFYQTRLFLPNPSARTGCDTRSIVLAEFNRFEFRVFLHLDQLPYQGYTAQSDLLFTNYLRISGGRIGGMLPTGYNSFNRLLSHTLTREA